MRLGPRNSNILKKGNPNGFKRRRKLNYLRICQYLPYLVKKGVSDFNIKSLVSEARCYVAYLGGSRRTWCPSLDGWGGLPVVGVDKQVELLDDKLLLPGWREVEELQ